jgi:hypothetical protein
MALVVHPGAPWLKFWDFGQALVITYLFVGALRDGRVSPCSCYRTSADSPHRVMRMPISQSCRFALRSSTRSSSSQPKTPFHIVGWMCLSTC